MKIFLVGAGPGDPELITVRGLELIQTCDVLVHDRLVSPALIAQANPQAQVINAGKGPEKKRYPQSEINRILIEQAQAGNTVVRLKGGDPFVFGLGGDEALALIAADIPFEVVPGISSITAVPAYAGIPITHRGLASSCVVLSGHSLDGPEWQHLPTLGTIVVLMGVRKLDQIVERVLATGRSAETPVAVIESGTTPAQHVIKGTLADIVEKTRAVRPPALTIIGEVVNISDGIDWFTGNTDATVWGTAQPALQDD